MIIVKNIIAAVVEAVENDADLQRRLRSLATLVGIGAPAPTGSHERQFDSIGQFAKRIGRSKRHVHDLRARGKIVTLGQGRGLKIDVQRSLDRLRHDSADDRDVARLDEARDRARAAARKVAGEVQRR